MKNILYIDTSDNKKISVRLETKGEQYSASSSNLKTRAQVTLFLIDKVCKKAGIKAHEIDLVRVKRGPGSFTGLRVGISIANALSFALGIPVNDKKVGEIETPKY